MKIGVIGAGRLGLTFALLCEQAGYEVIVSDVRQDYIDDLNKKIIDTNEPGVLSLLQKTNKFSATTNNLEVISKSDLIYTFVQTPSLPTGDYDISYLMKVVEDFGIAFENEISVNEKIFAIGCTTNPGDTKNIVGILNPYGVEVCYNPEFIAQGEIIKGLELADMVLVGSESQRVVSVLTDLYNKIQISELKICAMSTMAAEITKIGINCYLTTKISYANMIGEILTSSGLKDEVGLVLHSIGSDSRIGKKYLNYGFGFGGPCLPRDNRALGNYAQKIGLNVNLPYVVDDFNIHHADYLKNHYMMLNPDKTVPFVLSHVSYKKGTDMLVESQQLKLAYDLLNEGYMVNIIEVESIIRNQKFVSEISNDFPGKVKFYKVGTNPDGFKIEIE